MSIKPISLRQVKNRIKNGKSFFAVDSTANYSIFEIVFFYETEFSSNHVRIRFKGYDTDKAESEGWLYEEYITDSRLFCFDDIESACMFALIYKE